MGAGCWMLDASSASLFVFVFGGLYLVAKGLIFAEFVVCIGHNKL